MAGEAKPPDPDAPHDVYKCRVCCSRMWSDEAGLLGHELAKLYRTNPGDLRTVAHELTPRCFPIFNAAERLAQQRGVSLFRGTLSERGDIFAEVLRRREVPSPAAIEQQREQLSPYFSIPVTSKRISIHCHVQTARTAWWNNGASDGE